MSEPQQTPGQPSAAPQYPVNPPYGAAPRHDPAPQYSPAPPYGATPYGSAPASGNTLGRTAFLIAVVFGALGLLSIPITPMLYMSGNDDVADSLTLVLGLLTIVGNAVALVLGIVALRRPEPRLLAAVAVGLAGAAVVGRLFSWLGTLVWGML